MPEENIFKQENVEKKAVEKKRTLHQSDFSVGIIKPRHIDGVIITRGLSANRPDGSSRVLCWFATDTGVLSIWDGTAWLDITLS